MPLTDPVPSSSFDVLERNVQDTDKFVNQETGTFTNRVGKVIKPIPVIEAEAIASVISLGWTPVGEFATGFTYTKLNDVGRDSSGSWWKYNGSDLPKEITAGTVPSSPNFSVISFETADNIEWQGEKSVAYSLDDNEGFKQALLAEAGISDSGIPDTEINSQRLDAINKILSKYSRVFKSFSDMQAYNKHINNNVYLVIEDENIGQYVVSEDGDIILNGGLLAKFLYAKSDNRISYSQAGSFEKLLATAPKSPDTKSLFRKVSDNRFEVFTPFVSVGRYLRWRYDNDETQFNGAVPLDTAQGYTRPFLQTTVSDVTLETTAEVLASAATSSIPPVTSGSYLYVSGIGEYFEFTGILASRLRMTFNSTTNAGIVKVEINGSPALVNLIEKHNSGEARVDTYGAGGGKSVLLADNLPNIPLTVRITVVDKNILSTDYRFYSSELPLTGALRRYTPYVAGSSDTPTESVLETLKLGGSAVNYAISFRPDNNASANTPFVGSVHGYENREALTIYAGLNAVGFSTVANGVFIGGSSITVSQQTKMYHPDELVLPAALVNSTDVLSGEGFSSGYKLEWQYSPYITNGYTQMWTVYGANQGGAGGTQMGWADRVAFKGFDTYPLVVGDAAEYGHHVTDEVLFYGTDKTESRNLESGMTACLVKFADLNKSFSSFDLAKIAKDDAIWAQDRATFRKLYLQPLRAAGTIQEMTTLSGSMHISFFKSPKIAMLIGE